MGVLAECARSGVGCSGVGWSGIEDCSVLFEDWKLQLKIVVLYSRIGSLSRRLECSIRGLEVGVGC